MASKSEVGQLQKMVERIRRMSKKVIREQARRMAHKRRLKEVRLSEPKKRLKIKGVVRRPDKEVRLSEPKKRLTIKGVVRSPESLSCRPGPCPDQCPARCAYCTFCLF